MTSHALVQLGTLLFTAVAVGSLHAVAPDHWVPFAAVARSRNWSAPKTAEVTALCGFGHVTVSVLFGLIGVFFGIKVLQSFGSSMESVAGLLLVGFGIVYALWGLRRSAGGHLHGHSHSHYDHVHDPSTKTVGGLFLLSCVDPCVAVAPIIFAAAPLGAPATVAVVVAYEAATLAAMVTLVLVARAGATLIKGHLLDRYGDGLAGVLIAVLGVVIIVLGL
jgi:putative Mn2+ efflux pump MntP